MITVVQGRLLRFAVLFGLAMSTSCRPGPEPPTSPEAAIDEDLNTAEAALQSGNWKAAENAAKRSLETTTYFADTSLILGHALSQQEKYEEAVDAYLRAAEDRSPMARDAKCFAAELLFHRLGKSAQAEQLLQDVLAADQEHVLAHQALAMLYEVEGRRREMLPHLLAAIRGGQIDIRNLLVIGWDRGAVEEESVLERCRRNSPDDPAPLQGLAKIAARDNRFDDAITSLRELVKQRPAALEAQGLLGALLIRDGSVAHASEWAGQLPPAANESSDVWYARGLLSEALDQPQAAIRCFGEAVSRNADHEQAVYRLSRLLVSLAPDAATRLADRSDRQARFVELLKQVDTNNRDLPAIVGAAVACEQMGRFWEAWSWYRIAALLQPENERLQDRISALEEVLPRLPLTRTSPHIDLLEGVDLSQFPLPVINLPLQKESKMPAVPSDYLTVRVEDVAIVRFDDVAADVGLDFQYDNGHDERLEGLAMVESPGGGAAVLDFDGDDRPDLFFSQGGPRDGRASAKIRDQLFRNRQGKSFTNVTSASRLHAPAYHHGAAVGDFDADGFADLYVTGPGTNQLFHNNGDGTFSDVTAMVGLAAEAWTTSAVMADFNSDGHADLYDVNYLAGKDIFEMRCGNDGHPRVCHPAEFPGEQDRLLVNRGDGTFADVTSASGITTADGKGLGVIAADFDGSGRLSLFVANDTVANFLFHNVTGPQSPIPTFIENGLLSGTAFSSTGFPQASMGIAAADATGDGLLDVFVTNFYREPNAFYVARKADDAPSTFLFDDEIDRRGLRDAGFHKLGFGTQFLDADLDGFPDLAVTNGDIDDFSFVDRPFRQPCQFFRNHHGTFVEPDPRQTGASFVDEALGRGMARLDWNQDGRPDLVISFLDRPARLLENRTSTPFAGVAIRLVGTRSARDAVGTSVRISTPTRDVTCQLTAGDGYLASNERRLFAGLGSDAETIGITVHWPSGRQEQFSDVVPTSSILIIEDRGSLIHLP